ncbi:unnamed protein product [Caenorhabditis nigoni]
MVPSSASTRISMTKDPGLGHKSTEHFSIELRGYFQKSTTPRRSTAQYPPGGILLICTYPEENGICGHVNNIVAIKEHFSAHTKCFRFMCQCGRHRTKNIDPSGSNTLKYNVPTNSKVLKRRKCYVRLKGHALQSESDQHHPEKWRWMLHCAFPYIPSTSEVTVAKKDEQSDDSDKF